MAATSFHPHQQPREREREDKLGFEGKREKESEYERNYLQCFGLKDSRRLRTVRSDRISSKALKISPRYSPEFRERKQARSSSKSLEEVILFSLIISSMDSRKSLWGLLENFTTAKLFERQLNFLHWIFLGYLLNEGERNYLQCFGLKDSRRLRTARSDRISSKALKILPRYSPEFRERKQARSSSKSLEEVILFSLIISSMDSRKSLWGLLENFTTAKLFERQLNFLH